MLYKTPSFKGSLSTVDFPKNWGVSSSLKSFSINAPFPSIKNSSIGLAIFATS